MNGGGAVLFGILGVLFRTGNHGHCSQVTIVRQLTFDVGGVAGARPDFVGSLFALFPQRFTMTCLGGLKGTVHPVVSGSRQFIAQDASQKNCMH